MRGITGIKNSQKSVAFYGLAGLLTTLNQSGGLRDDYYAIMLTVIAVAWMVSRAYEEASKAKAAGKAPDEVAAAVLDAMKAQAIEEEERADDADGP